VGLRVLEALGFEKDGEVVVVVGSRVLEGLGFEKDASLMLKEERSRRKLLIFVVERCRSCCGLKGFMEALGFEKDGSLMLKER
jgi:hypothetical protein